MTNLKSNRRDFIKLSALATTGVGVMGCSSMAVAGSVASSQSDETNFSIQNTSESSSVDFNGDNMNRPHEILWDVEGYVKSKGGWPQVDRRTKIVVVGGGMSGLLTSYFLKDHKPLLLEQDSKLGGNSKGEIFNKSAYSIGAAYITVPDGGSSIETFLKEAKIFDKAKLEADADVQYFFKNEFIKGFWQGATDPKRASEFVAVANELKRIYDEEYPDIPYTKETAVSFEKWQQWDQISFQNWLLQKWPKLHPHILEFFQLYGWSSFNGSIDELSALQMLNFITAETVGILAFPAGNSLITFQTQKLLQQQGCPVESGAFVIRTKVVADGVVVTYEDAKGVLKAIHCEYCVMAAPKFVANKVIADFPEEQARLIQKISYRGYLVANIILNKKIKSPGFDIFTLTGTMPEAPAAMKPSDKGFTDVCFGSWAQNDQVDESVLTLYRPLPFDGARQFLFNPMAHEKTLKQIAPDLEIFLQKLGLSKADVKGIRLTRWGHSLPVAQVNLLASGNLKAMCKPIQDRIFFANQDNFANPAFETSFAAAEIAAGEILSRLN